MATRVQSTVVKAPKQALTLPQSNTITSKDNDMTVEQFLEMKFQEMVKDVRSHAEGLISNLRQEYVEGAAQINSLVVKPTESCKLELSILLGLPKLNVNFHTLSTDVFNFKVHSWTTHRPKVQIRIDSSKFRCYLLKFEAIYNSIFAGRGRCFQNGSFHRKII
jgi:hypothetical protein